MTHRQTAGRPGRTDGCGTLGDPLLAIVREEVREVLHGLPEHLHARQIDNAEVVGLTPVEAAAAGNEDLLLVQQVKGKLLVVRDVELLDVHLGEDVEGRLGLDSRDAIDGVERLVDVVTLLVDAAAGTDVLVDALVAAQGRLDD